MCKSRRLVQLSKLSRTNPSFDLLDAEFKDEAKQLYKKERLITKRRQKRELNKHSMSNIIKNILKNKSGASGY